jgi:hypothetical protein
MPAPAFMVDTDTHQLRVLIANERRDRLELLAHVVIGLGHDVIAREIYVREVGTATAREHPDVALVGLGSSSDHALQLISEIVREASCPVIAILHSDDPAYVHEAAKRGVFAYIIDGTPRRAAERDRHHAPALRRVPEPPGSVRTSRPDRAGKGHPHGPLRDQRRHRLREAPRPLAAQRPQGQRGRGSRACSTYASTRCRRSTRCAMLD